MGDDHFIRPDHEACNTIWDACKGNILLYVITILLVGFGAGGLSMADEHFKKSHPTLAHWIFETSPGIFITVFGLVGVILGIIFRITKLIRFIFHASAKNNYANKKDSNT